MATGLAVPDPPPRPTPEALASARRSRRLRHPVTIRILVKLGPVLLFAIIWTAARGYHAQRALNDAVPAADRVKTAIAAGDLAGAARAADELRQKTGDAAALTSDPIWITAEGVPWIGPNL